MKELVKKFKHPDGSETVIKRVRGKSIGEYGFPVEKDHLTTSIFISSSAGCAYKCAFCHLTEGNVPFIKLDSYKIVDNVMAAVADFPDFDIKAPVKLCWMGMGDPSMKVGQTVSATTKLLELLNVSEVDVSTVNLNTQIVDAYNWLNNRVKVRLFYSLHTTNQWLRTQLIPNTTNIHPAMGSLSKFNGERKIHYIPLKDCNDSEQEAMELAHLVDDYFFSTNMQVRLLEYNAAKGSKFERGDIARVRDIVTRAGIDVKWQVSKGKEENSACGQFI